MTAFRRLADGSCRQIPKSDLSSARIYMRPDLMGSTEITPAEYKRYLDSKDRRASGAVPKGGNKIVGKVSGFMGSEDRPGMRALYRQVLGHDAPVTGKGASLLSMAAAIYNKAALSAESGIEDDPPASAPKTQKASKAKAAPAAAGDKAPKEV